MQFSILTKTILAVALAGIFGITQAQAAPTTFTGSYVTNFDGLGASGTVMPLGFRAMTNTGGNTVFTAHAPLNQPYRVLGADDLSQPMSNWLVLATGVVTNSPVAYMDAPATNALRFYRIVSP